MNIDIAEVRRRTGKTQAEFCKWLHIPKRTYEKWEQGESVPPAYVLELIEYKVFCTYMVAPAPAPSVSGSSDVVQSDLDYKSLFDLMEKELDVSPLSSQFCVYRPEKGGCSHCLKPDSEDCQGFKLWVRYKEFCPD